MVSGFIFVVFPCGFDVLPLCLVGLGDGLLGEFEHIFCRHINIHQNDSVPIHNGILLWVRNFRVIVSATIRRRPGRDYLLRTPENIEQVHQDIVGSPQRRASRNAIPLKSPILQYTKVCMRT
jgi:hypothetical protein